MAVMRRTASGTLGLCLAVGLALSAASPAQAQDPKPPKVKASATTFAAPVAPATPSASPSPTTPTDALSTWLAATDAYKAATKDRAAAVAAINKDYTDSVRAAQAVLKSARASASTPAAKSAALSQYSAAVAAATEARQTALNNLPELPADPGPRPKTTPTKAPKATS